MPLEDRLRHTVVIERIVRTEDRSGRTPPSTTWSTVATVRAWLQPRERREASSLSGAGVVVSTDRAYLLPTDIREADVIHLVPDDGVRYEVIAVHDAAGKGHHYEVDLLRRTAGGA